MTKAKLREIADIYRDELTFFPWLMVAVLVAAWILVVGVL